MPSMLIHNAEINGRATADLLLRDGRVAAIGPGMNIPGDVQVLDARGHAVLPGLHDHHLHFFALVAARGSINCQGLDAARLGEEISRHSGEDWLRAVGYHEDTAGELDRHSLSALCPDRPLRLQHRSGKMWVLNDLACRLVGLDDVQLPGIERDAHGRATGRLFRLDDWLSERVPALPEQDINGVVREMYSYGITGFTDTSYTNNPKRVEALMGLPFDVYCMGDETLEAGHLKIMLDDDALPALDETVARVRAAHAQDRPVAFHCVSYVELLYLLEVMNTAGAIKGDRIEHGGVISTAELDTICRLGMTVVTQPGFLAHRGGQFLDALEEAHRDDLYPYKRLLDAGIDVVASSDAPYGPLNPWVIVAAAVHRRTEDGRQANADECVSAATAIQGYLSPPACPAGPERAIEVGMPANLCVLDSNLAQQLTSLSVSPVTHTLFHGEVVYVKDESTS